MIKHISIGLKSKQSSDHQIQTTVCFLYLRTRLCINSRHSYCSGWFTDHAWRSLVYLRLGHRWILSRKQKQTDTLKYIVSNIYFCLLILEILNNQMTGWSSHKENILHVSASVAPSLLFWFGVFLKHILPVTSDDWHFPVYQEKETRQVFKSNREPSYNQQHSEKIRLMLCLFQRLGCKGEEETRPRRKRQKSQTLCS